MRKSSVTMSLIFHATAFILAVVSFPFLKKDYDIAPPVSVELVTIDELNQTTKVAPKPVKPPEKKVEKPPAPPKPPTPAHNDSKEPTKVTRDPVKEEDPVKKEDKVLVDPNAAPEKKLTKKEEKLKKVTQTDEEKLQSLLKNLTKVTPEEKTEKTKDMKPDEKAQPDDGRPVPLGQRMTMTELDALRGQLEGCWTKMPAGARDAENLAVDVLMVIGRDRTIQTAKIVDEGRYNSDSFFRAVADSVKWALSDPNCSPLLLPPDKYDTWKQITITFDPADM